MIRKVIVFLTGQKLSSSPLWLLAKVLLVLSAFALPLPYTALAQVAPPITASGLNTQVNRAAGSSSQYDITGGTRPGGGPNLFHSFGQFGVPANNVANFFNDSGLATSNILSRVTGGNPSNIFGTIQTTGFGNANLFLMNPAGIVFGPTASLNVGGSVAFTTADYVRLGDGARFTVVPGPADAGLSSAPVAAFGFLGPTAGPITVQGSQLAVPNGSRLALVGGDITVQGGTLNSSTPQPARISAPGGQIHLASVASSGEVNVNTGAGQTIDSATNPTSFGNITLSQGARLDTSADAAGRVVIRGGQFTMEDASIQAISVNGAQGPSTPLELGPVISITADTVALTNGVHITADTHGSARAGDISFRVNDFSTRAGANHVRLNPDNATNITGNLIASDSRSPAADGGPAGNVTIEGLQGPGTPANRVVLQDTTLSSRVFGGTPKTAPSSITITADSLVFINEGLQVNGRAATLVANTIGPAPAGEIALHVNSLRSNVNADETPVEGAKPVFIVTSNNSGSDAGPTGTITVSGVRPDSTDAARLVALNNTTLSTGADGGTTRTPPGNITITTDTLSLSNDTGIFTASFGAATTPAGNINLNVNTLRAHTRPDGSFIEGKPQAYIVSASESGQAGSITISGVGPQTNDSAQLLTLHNIELNTIVFGGDKTVVPATITLNANAIHLTNSKNIKTDTLSAAPAGHVIMNASTVVVDQASKISSSTSGSGRGGTITINAGQSLTLSNGSSITAASTGQGDAGNIDINAGVQLVAQDAAITTQAARASGGNITVRATDAIRLVNSQINTSVQGGPTTVGGNILIDPAVFTLQNSRLLAQAVEGQGGNINVIAGAFLADQTSVVSASSQFGVSGTVNIQSPVSNLSGSLATLPQRPLQAHQLLQQRCAAQSNGQLSSFVVTARDTLPIDMAGWLLSPFALVDNAGFNVGLLEPVQPAGVRAYSHEPDSLAQLKRSAMAGCRS